MESQLLVNVYDLPHMERCGCVGIYSPSHLKELFESGRLFCVAGHVWCDIGVSQNMSDAFHVS
jgi:hypothetical protein